MNLSIDLTVRRGSNPDDTRKTVSVSLGTGDSEMVTYGNDENPYLDGMAINGVENGEIVATQDFTFERDNEIEPRHDARGLEGVVIVAGDDGRAVVEPIPGSSVSRRPSRTARVAPGSVPLPGRPKWLTGVVPGSPCPNHPSTAPSSSCT